MKNTSHASNLTQIWVSLPLSARLVLLLFIGAAVTAAFELLKQWAWPALSLWQSRAMTIGFGALLVAATRYFVSRRYPRLHQRVIDQEEALRSSEERFRSLVENAMEGIVVIQDRVFKYANPRTALLTGYSIEELIAKPFTDLIYPEDLPMVLDRYVRRVAGEAVCAVYPLRIIDKAGTVKWIENRATAIQWLGRPATLNLLGDITERKQAEAALSQSEQFLTNIIENIPDMIFVKDAAQLRFVLYNKAGKELLGLPSEQLLGKTDFDLVPASIAEQYVAKDREVLSNKQLLDIPEEPIQTHDKGARILHTKKIPILDDQGTPVYLLGISEDITERKRAEEKLLYVSIHDALTGLYNRTYFEEVLAQISHGTPYPISVIIIDIDGMKRTNDTQGHAAGDELLRRTAAVLKAVFRKGDIVARIGGDEFAMLLPQTDGATAFTVLNRLRLTLAEHNSSNNSSPLSLSMGAATAYEHDHLNQTITNADQHMYLDKQQHRYLLPEPIRQQEK